MMCAAASALLFALAAHIQVHEPASIAGEYEDEPLSSAPSEGYMVTATVAAAATCPCQWLWNAPDESTPLAGQILLIPDGVCTSACSVDAASCAASLYNASGLIVSYLFASNESTVVSGSSSFERDFRLETERATYAKRTDELPCDAIGRLPGSQISSNTSALLLSAANWSLTTLVVESALGGGDGSSLMNSSSVLLTPPDDVAVNVTLRHSPGESDVNCDKYESVPIIYAVSVPIWICLTIWWVWNTYYANAAHTRDIHRLLCWVPIIEVIHGVLSLFNYLSCPWGTILSLVYATFWSIVTILKEPVLLLCLLLVAKGWGVTRHALHRREVCVSGLVLALLYASVSVQMSLQQTILAQVPMIIMYVVMLIEIGWSIHSNLRILNGQQGAGGRRRCDVRCGEAAERGCVRAG